MPVHLFNYSAPRFRSEEAAGYIGLSVDSLNRSRRTGELMGTKPPRFIKIGHARNAPVIYTREELDRWMKQFKLQDFANAE